MVDEDIDISRQGQTKSSQANHQVNNAEEM